MSTERVIVERSVKEALVEEMSRIVKELRAGDPTTDKEAKLSCLFTESSAASFISLVEEAKAVGAKVLVGDGIANGCVVQPHLIVDVPRDSRAWMRESFAPGDSRLFLTRG